MIISIFVIKVVTFVLEIATLKINYKMKLKYNNFISFNHFHEDKYYNLCQVEFSLSVIKESLWSN